MMCSINAIEFISDAFLLNRYIQFRRGCKTIESVSYFMEGKESISELLDAEIHMYPLILQSMSNMYIRWPRQTVFSMLYANEDSTWACRKVCNSIKIKVLNSKFKTLQSYLYHRIILSKKFFSIS